MDFARVLALVTNFAAEKGIRFLLSLPGVDRAVIEAYFVKHNLGNRFRELTETT